jgi:hypothetical protein
MQQIAVLVNQAATEARNSAQACQGLSELAIDLQKMVANFQLRSDDAQPSHVSPSARNESTPSGKRPQTKVQAFTATAG